MDGKDLASVGDKEAGAECVEVHLRSGAGEAEHRIVAVVSERIPGGRETGIVQRESTIVITEGKHNVNQTDAWLVRFDDVLREPASTLKLFYASLYLSQLLLECGSGCGITGGNSCLQLRTLLLELCFLRITCRKGRLRHLIARAANAFEQLL